MAEPMTSVVEVYPIAADEAGLWLLTDGPITTQAVPSDSDPHGEAELFMGELHAHTVWLHSTSWRTEGPRLVVTYLAGIDAGGLVLDRYPEARPIRLALAEVVGPPASHAATERPVARKWDVLVHGLRHAKWLTDMDPETGEDHDATTRAALGELWVRHLAGLKPAMAMYTTRHVA